MSSQGSGGEMYSSPISHAHDVRVRIAYHLRHHRQAAGLTQSEVADGYNRRYGNGMRLNEISRYENAHSRPSDEKLAAFGELYGVDISVFYAPLPEDGAA